MEGDVQAGIEFIYHMREHLADIGIATVYGIAVYALILWIKRKLSPCECDCEKCR
tara:strand:+ start:638 stop:802 length:165 start_codon:yes stop_codon:yes gene_type:complete